MKKRKTDGAGLEARCRRTARYLAFLTARLLFLMKLRCLQSRLGCLVLCVKEESNPLLYTKRGDLHLNWSQPLFSWVQRGFAHN